MKRLAPALCMLCSLTAAAGQVSRAEVSHDKGTYHLLLDVELNADLAPVYAIATDFENLYRISPTIIESARLPSPGPGLERRKMVLRTCILFFCFDADFVEDAELVGHTIITTIVPEQSDFKSGRTTWEMSSRGPGLSRIVLETKVVPAFWIPPVIGPWLIKKKMMEEGRVTIERIEELASHG
ncbi:MAG TPA: hypothetical protein VIC61_03370 [Gammaproteobacteria bacterium]|jgi:hypothetical protein